MYFNCYKYVNNMQREQNTSKDLHDFDNELNEEKTVFRTVKSCPKCHSIIVTHRKWRRDYCCRNCLESFKDPVFKQLR
jgi:ribosomal protein S27AE